MQAPDGSAPGSNERSFVRPQHPYARFGNVASNASLNSPLGNGSPSNSNRDNSSRYDIQDDAKVSNRYTQPTVIYGNSTAETSFSSVSSTSSNASYRSYLSPTQRDQDSFSQQPNSANVSFSPRGPSFHATSNSSLPGALGIQRPGAVSANEKRTPLSPFGGFGSNQQASQISSSLSHHSGQPRSASSASSCSRDGTTIGNVDQDRQDALSSAHSGPASATKSSFAQNAPSSLGYGYGAGGASPGSGSGALGLNSGGTTRDFLVPIGTTGARQKLSILSPSQRRLGSAGGSTSNALGHRTNNTSNGISGTQSSLRPSAAAYSRPASKDPTVRSDASELSPRARPSAQDGSDKVTPPLFVSKNSGHQSQLRTPDRSSDDRDLSRSPPSSTPPRPIRSNNRAGHAASPSSIMSSSISNSSLASITRTPERHQTLSADIPTPTPTTPRKQSSASRSEDQTSATFAQPWRDSDRQLVPDAEAESQQQRHRRQQASDDLGTPVGGLSKGKKVGSPAAANALPSSDTLADLARTATPTQASVIAKQWRQGSGTLDPADPSFPNENETPSASALRTKGERDRSLQDTPVNVSSAQNERRPSVPEVQSILPYPFDASNDSTMNEGTLSASSSGAFSSNSVSRSSSDVPEPGMAGSKRLKGKLNKMLISSKGRREDDSRGDTSSSMSSNRGGPATSHYGKERDFSEASLADSYWNAVNRGGVGATGSRGTHESEGIGRSTHIRADSRGLSRRSDVSADSLEAQNAPAQPGMRTSSSGEINPAQHHKHAASQHSRSSTAPSMPVDPNEENVWAVSRSSRPWRPAGAAQQPSQDVQHIQSHRQQQTQSHGQSDTLGSSRSPRQAAYSDPITSSMSLDRSNDALKGPLDTEPIRQDAPALQLGDWGDDLNAMLPSYLDRLDQSGEFGSGLETPISGSPPSNTPKPSSSIDQGVEGTQIHRPSLTGLPESNAQNPQSPPHSLPLLPSVQQNVVGGLDDSDASSDRKLQSSISTSSLKAPSQPEDSLPSTKIATSAQDSSNGIPEANTKAADTVDPKTYVPKGALSHNRKGTAVSAKAARQSSDKVTAALADRLFPSGSASSEDQFGLSDDEDDMVVPFDSGTTLPSSAWAEVEHALMTFRGQTEVPFDKGVLIRNVLLPFLALEAETPNVGVSDGKFRSAKARRALFFDWIAHLLIELQHVQTSADRGAILESIACIIESRNLSVNALMNDAKDEAKFSSTFGHILLYAIGELNKKGVYQNTLIFSGRLLAIAFFRVDGVASKLLRALPINRFAMERVAAEAEWEKRAPKNFNAFVARFPPSLRDFCFSDARAYLRALDAQSTAGDESENDRYLVRQPEVEVEMTGNWLRRWQSDDSELFFSFCRSYHRQLAGLLSSTRALQGISKRFFGGPGYAHLATCIHLKCLSLVNRVILSVTTLSSQKNFNPGETANVLSGSTAGKPRHLEAANRRCTAIIVDIVRAPSGNNQTFLPMLGTHIKCLVKRTSLYDVQSVFCLLDWLDGVLGHMDAADLPIEKLVDVDFLIEMIGLLLENADHALALMRTVAFCYSNFAVLIGTSEHRKKFCEDILLNRKVFHKLFLSWSFTIRAYFLHLLVFRLARLKDFTNPQDDPMGKTSVEIAKLFNCRLDEIRKRHEELCPPSPQTPDKDESGGATTDDGKSQDGDASSTYSRIKSSRTSFVSTIRHTPSIHQADQPVTVTKAERVLGIGMPDPVLTAKHSEPKAQSRAAKWLRALGGKSGSKSKHAANGSVDMALLSPPTLDSPNISNRPRFKPRPFDFDFDDDDDDNDDDGDDVVNGDGHDSDDDVAPVGTAATGTRNTAGGKKSSATQSPRADKRRSRKDSKYEFDFESRRQRDQEEAANASPRHGNVGHHNDHITPDATFDLQSPHSPSTEAHILPPAASRNSATASPHISRAFSKRGSMLPGPAHELVENESNSPKQGQDMKIATNTEGYPESLQVYATQGLREWEAVLAEHDEFFATMADQSGPPAVPRLPVQWPAMWSD
ncbi:unnamed protein product [Sympodiomycopsis kandeliae]